MAKADIDNSLFQLNDMDEGNSSRELGKSIESNINFAERIELLTATEAKAYRERLIKIRNDRDRRQRVELISKSRNTTHNTDKDFIRDKNEQRVSRQKVENIATAPSRSQSKSDTTPERSR